MSRPTGRPDSYTEQRANEVIDLMLKGHSAREISDMDGMPCTNTIYGWCARHPDFMTRYVAAIQVKGLRRGDEIEDLAQEVRDGVVTSDVARTIFPMKAWLAAREAPRVYSEKLRIAGDRHGDPIRVEGKLSEEDRERIDNLDTAGIAREYKNST